MRRIWWAVDHVSLHTSTRPEIHTEGLDAASVFSYHLQGDSLRELLPLPSDGNAQDVPGERARDEDGAPTPLHRLIHAYSVLSRLVHVNARRLDDLPHLGRRLTGRGGTQPASTNPVRPVRPTATPRGKPLDRWTQPGPHPDQH